MDQPTIVVQLDGGVHWPRAIDPLAETFVGAGLDVALGESLGGHAEASAHKDSAGPLDWEFRLDEQLAHLAHPVVALEFAIGSRAFDTRAAGLGVADDSADQVAFESASGRCAMRAASRLVVRPRRKWDSLLQQLLQQPAATPCVR